MGKYMKKAKITGEVAVMELTQSSLGVITRAKTLALQRLQKNSVSSPSYLQLRSRRLEKPPIASAPTEPKKAKDACKENPNPRLVVCSANSGSATSVMQSCSDKNAPASVGKEGFSREGSSENEVCVEASFGENVLEIDGRERNVRETTPSSLIRDSETLGTPGSTTRPTNSTATNRRIQNAMLRNIPTAHEMEEFFAGAEQHQQRIFTEKYNYDPVNDLPLPGRYEWVRVDL
ncbi:cyclin-dependent kinase inhibitor 5-like [Magnolia sinica]|uniref:cyclin-dependent kinase inhibitor 5-like n=1 Tax=Magnolia sinica TaxID=86752 RepID=UPI00265A78A1|nr:cyclin-dependent kinase inhibitor 5-like [Magnolia sinica]